MVNYLAPAYVHVRSDENSRDVISNGSLVYGRPYGRTGRPLDLTVVVMFLSPFTSSNWFSVL